jgi:hypothetical protein
VRTLRNHEAITDAAARLAFNRRTSSILDVLNRHVSRLKSSLGPTDRTKVAEYLDSRASRHPYTGVRQPASLASQVNMCPSM